jgi:ADP-heptose:LPS heptosyltransferase
VDVSREKQVAREYLRSAYPRFDDTTHLVLLNPDPGLLVLRGWGADRYAELAQRLLTENSNVLVGIVGLSRSTPLFETISRSMAIPERVVNLCGVTNSMREALGFFSLASVMVTNDSGPAHFAPLVGLPTVTLFGPESPRRYEPLSSRNTSLYAGLSCSPCFSAQNHRHSVCTHNACMRALSVSEVFSAASRWLGDTPRHARASSLPSEE